MKKVLLTLAVLFGGFALASAQEVVNGPVITLDKEVHDYGTMQQNADGNCVFTVTNDGSEPLIISRCKGSCGCTVPQCDKDPIMPGATSTSIWAPARQAGSGAPSCAAKTNFEMPLDITSTRLTIAWITGEASPCPSPFT